MPRLRPFVLARTFTLESLEERVVPAGLIGDLVIFGDSLADEGNFSAVTGGFLPGPLYSNGRYSGGPIWVDTLAEYLRESAPTASLLGGLDYAFGGATVAVPSEFNPYGTPSVGEQVCAYLEDFCPDADDVFAFWAGANDFFYTFSVGPPINPEATADALTASIKKLIYKGGEHFVVNNLPPLGQTPFFQDLLKANFIDQDTVNAINGWSAGFNFFLHENLEDIRECHPEVTIAEVDVSTLFGTLAQPNNPLGLTNFDSAVGPYETNPMAPNYGFLTDITAANPQNFLFFDSVHPGTTAHQFVGAHAAAEVLTDLGINTLLVSTTADTINPLDGKLSLREVLRVTELMDGMQTVKFNLGAGAKNIALTKELTINDDTTIVGTGQNKLSLGGRGLNRIFNVGPEADVTISKMKLHNGRANMGGAILNAGDLTLADMTFVGNLARSTTTASGGAIYNTGDLDVIHSTFAANRAVAVTGANGGAIASAGFGASLDVSQSTFVQNSATGNTARGGAIYAANNTVLRLVNSLLLTNSALGNTSFGGGVFIGAGVLETLTNNLVFLNFATTGPNIFRA